MSLRTRSILLGVLAAVLLTVLIIIGSRGFRWFDAALIGYAVATIFAAAAVTYKYTFWLARPPTGRYWRRSWRLVLSYANFRRYTSLIPKAIITDLLSQQFIRKRGFYRRLAHRSSTHPGTRMPMALLSARLTTERILEEMGVPSPALSLKPRLSDRIAVSGTT